MITFAANFSTFFQLLPIHMVVFFKKGATLITAVDTDHKLSDVEKQKLSWLFDGAKPLASTSVSGTFIGPRKEMITPWSTNAVEITQNMV